MEKYKAHILVVDDDDGIRELVKQFLNKNNYLVTTAKNAEDALEKVKIIKFDLIVLDIMMPGKSGLEFTNENKKKLDTPIILLTAKGEASDRIEGLEIGADDYLAKPFEPKELILRINNILKKTKFENSKRVIEFGSIKIDLNKLFIYRNQQSLKINNTEKEILISNEKARVTPNNEECANVPAKKDNLLQITKQPRGPVTRAIPRPATSALIKKSSNIYFFVSIVPSGE